MKIDIGSIEGYEQMSAEDKVKALEAFEYDDKSTEVERYKAAVSKANGEAAEWKRKHNALLSAEDQQKQARDDEVAMLKEALERAHEKELFSEYKANFSAIHGYDEELAKSSAEALLKKDFSVVFANQKKALELHDKAVKADIMKGTGRPPAGQGTVGLDYDKKIAEARERGNMAEVAYLMRLKQQKE